MAGAEGLEPSTKVLETHVLPLHHTPKCHVRYYIPQARESQVFYVRYGLLFSFLCGVTAISGVLPTFEAFDEAAGEYLAH